MARIRATTSRVSWLHLYIMHLVRYNWIHKAQLSAAYTKPSHPPTTSEELEMSPKKSLPEGKTIRAIALVAALISTPHRAGFEESSDGKKVLCIACSTFQSVLASRQLRPGWVARTHLSVHLKSRIHQSCVERYKEREAKVRAAEEKRLVSEQEFLARANARRALG
ncbi:hypothetical protein BC629DRAFT_1477571 [Irpex lacteus]|nr:hypothetical protein BC629DRAFT_1477571 [Irpex lacteus]